MEKKKKNKVVKSWVHEHLSDIYVDMAHKTGYRSRAAYKLLELHKENNLFKQGYSVVDLGCAPGSWSQVALELVGENGKVVGLDLLEIMPISNLKFIQGDFTEQSTLDELVSSINAKEVDLVISDMAPNMSGVKVVDQAKSAYLVELVLEFCKDYLRKNGNCLIKVFHGYEFESLVKKAREDFSSVVIRKPDASRGRSSEVYLLCKGKL